MLRSWWFEREPRERFILIVGSIIVALTIGYSFFWSPLVTKNLSLKHNIAENTTLLNWMESVTNRINQYKQQGYKKHQSPNQSLLVTIESSLAQSHLDNYVSSTQQVDQNQIKLTFKNVSFDKTMDWVESLWKSYNITIYEADIKKTKNNGDASIVIVLSSHT